MFGEDGVARSEALAPAYKAFAQANGIEFIDAAQYAQAVEVDGVHMGPESHGRLGKAFAENVKEMIG